VTLTIQGPPQLLQCTVMQDGKVIWLSSLVANSKSEAPEFSGSFLAWLAHPGKITVKFDTWLGSATGEFTLTK